VRILIIVMTISALGGVNSNAASPQAEVSAPFTYSKDFLLTQAGANQMLSDLVRLARKSCRILNTADPYIVRSDDRDCIDELVSDAVIKIDAPKLSEAYSKCLTKVRAVCRGLR